MMKSLSKFIIILSVITTTTTTAGTLVKNDHHDNTDGNNATTLATEIVSLTNKSIDENLTITSTIASSTTSSLINENVPSSTISIPVTTSTAAAAIATQTSLSVNDGKNSSSHDDSRLSSTQTTTTTITSTSTVHTPLSSSSSSSTTPPPSSTSTSTSKSSSLSMNITKSTMTKQNNSNNNNHKNKWSINSEGNHYQLPYSLNCSMDSMVIQVNISSLYRLSPTQDDKAEPYVYLEKLRSFSICRPQIENYIATFKLSLNDDFYRCGTTKIHDQITGTRIYYNRIVVEYVDANDQQQQKSIYFKCSQPNIDRLLGFKVEAVNDDDSDDNNGDDMDGLNGLNDSNGSNNKTRIKRSEEVAESSAATWIQDSTGRLVNFTEIDLPENFMEAEVLDFTDNITARAPYPHLNLKVKRNGKFVNQTLNVAPGTPLEMIIYLDDDSKHVYGLLASFMKVTDNTNRQQEVIVLNGCSIDPYIFGNFISNDNGDSIQAKFRAFKFPESNYVMFIGTVNVCLDKCQEVPCGNDIYALGRRRRRRRSAKSTANIPMEMPKDPNKVYEIEMMSYLRIGYSDEELAERYRRQKKQSTIQAVGNIIDDDDNRSQNQPEIIASSSSSTIIDHSNNVDNRMNNDQHKNNDHVNNAQYESLTSGARSSLSSNHSLIMLTTTIICWLWFQR